jgi:group I intron endonuclease
LTGVATFVKIIRLGRACHEHALHDLFSWEADMFVYLVSNKINGKKYVGQHSGPDLQRYWKKTIYRALRGSDDRVRSLYLAIRKYGPDNFEIKPLVIVGTREELNYYEIGMIRALNTKSPEGYNLTDGGDGIFNLSQESRQKMSESHTGKKQSEETKSKRIASLRGLKRSEETKLRMSQAQLGNKNCLGREVSKDTREKIAKKNLGNRSAVGAVRTPEYCAAISKRQQGRKFSDTTRARMSASAKKRIASQETRDLMSGIHKSSGLRPPVRTSEEAAEAGRISGHKRYHIARGLKSPTCKFCSTQPE